MQFKVAMRHEHESRRFVEVIFSILYRKLSPAGTLKKLHESIQNSHLVLCIYQEMQRLQSFSIRRRKYRIKYSHILTRLIGTGEISTECFVSRMPPRYRSHRDYIQAQDKCICESSRQAELVRSVKPLDFQAQDRNLSILAFRYYAPR